MAIPRLLPLFRFQQQQQQPQMYRSLDSSAWGSFDRAARRRRATFDCAAQCAGQRRGGGSARLARLDSAFTENEIWVYLARCRRTVLGWRYAAKAIAQAAAAAKRGGGGGAPAAPTARDPRGLHGVRPRRAPVPVGRPSPDVTRTAITAERLSPSLPPPLPQPRDPSNQLASDFPLLLVCSRCACRVICQC